MKTHNIITLIGNGEPLDDGWFNCLLLDTKQELDLCFVEKDLRHLNHIQEANKVKEIREKIYELEEKARNEARKVILEHWDEYFDRVNPKGGHAWQLNLYKRSDFRLKGGAEET